MTEMIQMHYNTWLTCQHVDYRNNTALVKSNRTGKSFPVHLPQKWKFEVNRGDRLHVIKSHISKEWIAIDFNKMTAMTTGDEEEVNTYEY